MAHSGLCVKGGGGGQVEERGATGVTGMELQSYRWRHRGGAPHHVALDCLRHHWNNKNLLLSVKQEQQETAAKMITKSNK